MARGILAFFGGLSILAGIIIIVGGIASSNGTALMISLASGSGFLIAGAPLLGFARVIVLLEEIARNTAARRAPKAEVFTSDSRPGTTLKAER